MDKKSRKKNGYSVNKYLKEWNYYHEATLCLPNYLAHYRFIFILRLIAKAMNGLYALTHREFYIIIHSEGKLKLIFTNLNVEQFREAYDVASMKYWGAQEKEYAITYMKKLAKEWHLKCYETNKIGVLDK